MKAWSLVNVFRTVTAALAVPPFGPSASCRSRGRR